MSFNSLPNEIVFEIFDNFVASEGVVAGARLRPTCKRFADIMDYHLRRIEPGSSFSNDAGRIFVRKELANLLVLRSHFAPRSADYLPDLARRTLDVLVSVSPPEEARADLERFICEAIATRWIPAVAVFTMHMPVDPTADLGDAEDMTLLLAISMNRLDLVSRLLENGANPWCYFNGMNTSWAVAAATKSTAMLELLGEHAQRNHRVASDSVLCSLRLHGATEQAIWRAQPSIAMWLINWGRQHGFPLTGSQSTILFMIVTTTDKIEALRFLLGQEVHPMQSEDWPNFAIGLLERDTIPGAVRISLEAWKACLEGDFFDPNKLYTPARHGERHCLLNWVVLAKDHDKAELVLQRFPASKHRTQSTRDGIMVRAIEGLDVPMLELLFKYGFDPKRAQMLNGDVDDSKTGRLSAVTTAIRTAVQELAR